MHKVKREREREREYPKNKRIIKIKKHEASFTRETCAQETWTRMIQEK